MRRPAVRAGGVAWWSGRSMRPARKSRARATAGVKRHYLGCAGKVANGITTVHLSYVRERTGHALIGARQWIPRRAHQRPGEVAGHGAAADLVFRTKGQLAIDICTEAFADGVALRFRLRGRGLRQLHRAARVLRRPRPGICAAGPVQLPPHPGRGVTLHLRAGGHPPAERRPPLGGPLRRDRLQGPALVCVGVAGHRLPAALPADPPPPGQPASWPFTTATCPKASREQGPADPRRRAALAGRRRFRVRARTASAWTSPRSASTPRSPATPSWSWPPWPSAPSPPPCCATAPIPRRRRRSRPDQPPPADPGMIPLTVPEITRLLATRPPGPARRPRRALGGLAAPPPGPLTLVPPAHPARP